MDPYSVDISSGKIEDLFGAGQYRCADIVCLTIRDLLHHAAPDSIQDCRFWGYPVGGKIAEDGCGAVMGGIKALAQYGGLTGRSATEDLFVGAERLRTRFKRRHRSMFCPAPRYRFQPVPAEFAGQCLVIIKEVVADVIEIITKTDLTG